jgi:hypothetical protein
MLCISCFQNVVSELCIGYCMLLSSNSSALRQEIKGGGIPPEKLPVWRTKVLIGIFPNGDV